jgi:hypothetical protein
MPFITYACVFVLSLICMQFVSQVVSNPPVTGEFSGPDSIKVVFERACYDCHSNETKLKWYDKIAPVSWKVSADVLEARKRFNFSTWDSLSLSEQTTKLWYMVNMIEQNKMPLKSYVTVHPSAKVSQTELSALKNYLVAITKQASVPKHARTSAAKIITKARLPTSLNGIDYFPDYRHWKVIATTNRFDNGTMRVIFGNDVAVRAVHNNTVDPWPDGAILVKVVWNKLAEDNNGNISPGDFNNVQFMIKDKERFKDTGGWGFARFSTPQLVPYGKTKSFELECFSCHKLASENGFVFDIPTTTKNK